MHGGTGIGLGSKPNDSGAACVGTLPSPLLLLLLLLVLLLLLLLAGQLLTLSQGKLNFHPDIAAGLNCWKNPSAFDPRPLA